MAATLSPHPRKAAKSSMPSDVTTVESKSKHTASALCNASCACGTRVPMLLIMGSKRQPALRFGRTAICGVRRERSLARSAAARRDGTRERSCSEECDHTLTREHHAALLVVCSHWARSNLGTSCFRCGGGWHVESLEKKYESCRPSSRRRHARPRAARAQHVGVARDGAA